MEKLQESCRRRGNGCKCGRAGVRGCVRSVGEEIKSRDRETDIPGLFLFVAFFFGSPSRRASANKRDG